MLIRIAINNMNAVQPWGSWKKRAGVHGRSVHVANPARYKTKSSQSLVKT